VFVAVRSGIAGDVQFDGKLEVYNLVIVVRWLLELRWKHFLKIYHLRVHAVTLKKQKRKRFNASFVPEGSIGARPGTLATNLAQFVYSEISNVKLNCYFTI